jgi:hypothetical protein
MAADLDLLRAAQEKADAVIRAVADHDFGAGPYLMVSVTDPATGQRLATGFVAYGPARHLRLVEAS